MMWLIQQWRRLLHLGGDQPDGVYVVINAGDQRVTLANNNGYLGNTKSPPVRLKSAIIRNWRGPISNRPVIFTDPQHETEMATTDVDTRSATTVRAEY
ncbi:hypothetical protein ACNKHM_22300 [Shigella sonnei]